MTPETSPFLTVRELAQLLRVKERKVYALAASGEIPCNRAMGKLLFPRADVEAWLARHDTGRGPGGVAPQRPIVVVGSHDPLLDWALRESRSGIAAFFDGSLDGLRRLADGQAMAAGIHLHESDGEWNRGHVAQALPGAPVVLLEWAWRDRGLIVAAGNARKLRRLSDLVGLRVMPRQPESGSQMLFDALLERAGIAAGALKVMTPPARNESDVALAVAEDKADAGFGLAGVARQFGLGFAPLLRERYDIVVFRRAYFLDPFQRFFDFCRTPAFAAKARELGGYDLAGFGRVHYVGP